MVLHTLWTIILVIVAIIIIVLLLKFLFAIFMIAPTGLHDYIQSLTILSYSQYFKKIPQYERIEKHHERSSFLKS